MKILTWNIQATKGCDDRYDAPRIISLIKEYGELDVICLQEVSRNIPDLNADDQVAMFQEQFAEFESVWGPGFSSPGDAGRAEFGNLTLVKPSIFCNSHLHILPAPVVNTTQMPRTMVETVITTAVGDIAIYNTHLAFHSEEEQIEQMGALTVLRDRLMKKSVSTQVAEQWGPYRYADNGQGVILCGDLNIDSDGDLFNRTISSKNWIDCWTAQQDDKRESPRQPTCGCHDHAQWPQGTHVRDYFLATNNIAKNTINVEVNIKTDASDHQPVLLEIAL